MRWSWSSRSCSLEAEFLGLGQSWARVIPQASPQRQRPELRLIWTHLIAPLLLCPISNFIVGQIRGGGLDWDQTQTIVPPQQRAAQASLHCPGDSLKPISGGPSFFNLSALRAVCAGFLGCLIPTLPVDPAAFVGVAAAGVVFRATLADTQTLG